MLTLDVRIRRGFNEQTSEIIYEHVRLELEHSLVSLSKWETNWEKPYLVPGTKTDEEALDYIKCMILTEDYPPDVFEHFTQEHGDAIAEYIDKKMTATWFAENKNSQNNKKTITSELIYYWITSYKINWEVQYWHLNRLFTLIKVFNEEHDAAQRQSSGKKRSPQQMAAERRALNEQRRAQMKSNG